MVERGSLFAAREAVRDALDYIETNPDEPEALLLAALVAESLSLQHAATIPLACLIPASRAVNKEAS